MIDIKQWLSGEGSYNDGLKLFLKYSANRCLKHYLTRKCDMLKLRYELAKLCPLVSVSQDKSATDKLIKNSAYRLSVLGEGQIRYSDLPDNLKTIYGEICRLYKKMRYLHVALKTQKNDADRNKTLDELLVLDKIRAAKFSILDKWSSTGELPSSDSSSPTSKNKPEPTTREVNSARASITRNLELLKKETKKTKISEYKERISKAVLVVIASGGSFGKNAELLKKYDLLPS